ncbi:MAG: hypothetical protein AAF533_01720 [Acidobacteriota bacterium]
MKQITFRLDPDLIARLDAYALHATEANPGLSVNRTDAVRLLLEAGLAEAGFGSVGRAPTRSRTGLGARPRDSADRAVRSMNNVRAIR